MLAAGRGKRFPGVASKVLVPLQGRPLLLRVLDAVRGVAPERVLVVLGHGREAVASALRGLGVETVDQGEPRGTGHALLAAAPALGRAPRPLLVLNGDVPLLRTRTLARLHEAVAAGADGALVTAVLPDGGAYGRVVRRRDGLVGAVVEAADAPRELLALPEVNVGAYAFRAPDVFDRLVEVGSDNAQGEIYLTDAVRRIVEEGGRVEAIVLDDAREGLGVNTPEELALLEDAARALAEADGQAG